MSIYCDKHPKKEAVAILRHWNWKFQRQEEVPVCDFELTSLVEDDGGYEDVIENGEEVFIGKLPLVRSL